MAVLWLCCHARSWDNESIIRCHDNIIKQQQGNWNPRQRKKRGDRRDARQQNTGKRFVWCADHPSPDTQTHMRTHRHAHAHRDGMNWNGQELTADSNEIHYVGVKEVTNNIRQGLPSEHGGWKTSASELGQRESERGRERGTGEGEGEMEEEEGGGRESLFLWHLHELQASHTSELGM